MKRNPNSKPRVHLCHHPMNIVVSTLPSHLQHQPGKKLKEKRDKEDVKLPSLCFPLLQPPTIQSALTHIYYKETQLTKFVFVLDFNRTNRAYCFVVLLYNCWTICFQILNGKIVLIEGAHLCNCQFEKNLCLGAK